MAVYLPEITWRKVVKQPIRELSWSKKMAETGAGMLSKMVKN